MKLERVLPRIYSVTFEDQRELAATFLRFQEFSESPDYHGKVFTADEYLASPAAMALPEPYLDFWDGFNIPGWVFRVFECGLFDPLSANERRLVEFMASLAEPCEFACVIGTKPGDDVTLNHEVAHGIYYVDPAYRLAAQGIIAAAGGLEGFPDVVSFLKSIDYADRVMLDELHAYLAFEHAYLREQGLDLEPYRATSEALLGNFHDAFSRLKKTT